MLLFTIIIIALGLQRTLSYYRSSFGNRQIHYNIHRHFEKENDAIFGSEFLFTKNKNKKAVKIENVIQRKDGIASVLDDGEYRKRVELKQKSLKSIDYITYSIKIFKKLNAFIFRIR